MAKMIGILADVSIKRRIQNRDDQPIDQQWGRSVFNCIENLTTHEASTNDDLVFAIAYGTSVHASGTLDLLTTVKKQTEYTKYVSKQLQKRYVNKRGLIEASLSILKQNGAHFDTGWAPLPLDMEMKTIPKTDLLLLHDRLMSDQTYVDAFVGPFYEVSIKDIRESIAKVKSNLFLIDSSVEVVPYRACLIPDILQGDESAAYESARRLDELVEPSVRSENRPFYKALAQASKKFCNQRYSNRRKLLFVMSGGSPNLSSALLDRIEKMKQNGVTVVCCYITNGPSHKPMWLYRKPQHDWDDDAKLMCDYCSDITLDKLPPTTNSGQVKWVIESGSVYAHGVKMFLLLDQSGLCNSGFLIDFCCLAMNAFRDDQDALLHPGLLSAMAQKNRFAQCINLCKKGLCPKQQKGGTCYANATAAVVHLATRRILSRDGGYPEFDDVRQDIIQQYGKNGANTQRVLEDVCPQYRLRFQSVKAQGAFGAIYGRRPVIANFLLTDVEWRTFSDFYRNNPKGILTKDDINIANRQPGEATKGHAVVFTSFKGEYMRFMNSWGTDWADGGFFRVKNADVLGFKFFDVFWYESDLSRKEKNAWVEAVEKVGADLNEAGGYDELNPWFPRIVLNEAVNYMHIESGRKCYGCF